MSHRKHFGKFHHIGEFLNSFKKSQNNEKLQHIHDGQPKNAGAQAQELKKPIADLVEVQAVIEQDFGDQHEHYQFYINITQLVTPSNDNAIDNDVRDCITHSSKVFLAVRYGDNEGLSQPIDGNINQGDKLHLKGQWITAEKAYAHAGEKTSVLHFTHHPVGFICTVEKCFS